MLKFALAFFAMLALPASAQYSVTFIPLTGVEQVFPHGRDYSLWSVRVCAEADMVRAIPRERILNAVPSVPMMPNELAFDLLTRDASRSKWAVLGRIGGLLVQYAPAGLSLWGATTGDTTLAKSGAIAGLSMGLLGLGVNRAVQRTPAPQPYFERFLPPAVVLTGRGCSEYYAASARAPQRVYGPVLVNQDFDFGLPSGTQPQVAPTSLRVYDPATGKTVTYNLERLRKLRAAYLAAGYQDVFEIPPDYWEMAKGVR